MRAALCVAFLLPMLSNPAIAEPGPIGRWLMNEPLSLWDKGMFAAMEDVKETVEGMKATYGVHASGGVGYSWDNNEIELWANVRELRGAHTHEHCNRMRRAFINRITDLSHSSQPWPDPDIPLKLTHWKVHEWFSHYGYVSGDRDKKLSEKLARIIFVKIIVGNSKTGVVCRDRITSPDAPSKPWKPLGATSNR